MSDALASVDVGAELIACQEQVEVIHTKHVELSTSLSVIILFLFMYSLVTSIHLLDSDFGYNQKIRLYNRKRAKRKLKKTCPEIFGLSEKIDQIMAEFSNISKYHDIHEDHKGLFLRMKEFYTKYDNELSLLLKGDMGEPEEASIHTVDLSHLRHTMLGVSHEETPLINTLSRRDRVYVRGLCFVVWYEFAIKSGFFEEKRLSEDDLNMMNRIRSIGEKLLPEDLKSLGGMTFVYDVPFSSVQNHPLSERIRVAASVSA
jgi:hypothetical protein